MQPAFKKFRMQNAILLDIRIVTNIYPRNPINVDDFDFFAMATVCACNKCVWHFS